MPSHTQGSGRQKASRRRTRKAAAGRGYRFLSEPIAPKQTFAPDPDRVAALRRELEEYRGKPFPWEPLSPLEELQTLYKTIREDTEFPCITQDQETDALHICTAETIDYATSFGYLPIGFTYRMGTFGRLVRGAVRATALALGISDLRDSYYVSMLEDIAEDNRQEYDEDDDEWGEGYWQTLKTELNDLMKGQTCMLLNEFWNEDTFRFEQLHSYNPKKKERPLYDVLLKAEEVIRGALDLRECTASQTSRKDEMSEDGNFLTPDSTLCITWSVNSCSFIEELDNYINSDLDSDVADDAIIAWRELRRNAPDNTAKIRQEVDYIHELRQILMCYDRPN